MKKIAIVAITLVLSLHTQAQQKDKKAILDILKKQETAWNNGDLDAFMQGYWKSDSLLFIGKGGHKYGYATILENYKKSYPNKTYMGLFTSTVLQIKRLGKNYFFVLGKWHLKRTVGDVSGYYTLIFQKINREWVIISDHSS